MREGTVKNWIGDRLVVPAVQGLDKRMKRIVALASLFGYLLKPAKRNKDLELRLSRTMDLAVDSSSLTLPMMYHDLVWHAAEKRSNARELIAIRKKFASDLQGSVSQEEANKYASVLLTFMPSCLLYDSEDTIRGDIIHLFESIPYILGGFRTA